MTIMVIYRAYHGIQTRNIMVIMVIYRAHHGVKARNTMAINRIIKFAIVS